MEFIFVFAIVLIKILLLHFFKAVEIIRAFGAYTFMYAEEFTVFLGSQGISTVRTGKAERCCNDFTGAEGLTADFALVLAITAVIIIDVMVRGAA